MLTETGRVVALKGSDVWVETLRVASCDSCAARSGCGHGMLNAALPGASKAVVKARLPEHNPPSIELHDAVQITLPEGRFLHGVALLYVIPLVCALLGAVATHQWLPADLNQGQKDFSILIATLIALGGGLLFSRWVTHHSARADHWHPRVTAIVPRHPGQDTAQEINS